MCLIWSVIAVSSHHPQEVFLAQFSPLVHKSDLKTHSFHFITVWKHHSERKHALFNYLFTGMFWYNNYQECCCDKHRCYIPWGDAATIFSCFPRKERNGPWALQFAARAGTRWRKSCPVKANSSNLLLLFAFARHGRIEHFITFLETIMTDMLGWRFFFADYLSWGCTKWYPGRVRWASCYLLKRCFMSPPFKWMKQRPNPR